MCVTETGRGVASRFDDDLGRVASEEFRRMCRTRPQDLARDRKLPCEPLVETLLARRGRSMSLDLRRPGKDGLMETKAGKVALCRAREKLNPLAVRDLVRFHSAQVYEDGGYETWNGLIPVGIDGTTVDVDTNPETLERWGNASNPGTAPHAQAGVSTASDPPDRQIVDLSVGPCALDERGEVPGHVEACRAAFRGAPFCVIMDRGYPSIDLLATLLDAGAHFLVRCPKTFLAAEFAECEAAGGDLVVDVRPARQRLHRLREAGRHEDLERLLARGTLRLRLVLVDVGGKEPQRLVTDLPGTEETAGPDLEPIPGVPPIPAGDLADLYHLRWDSETSYRFEKEILELENFSGRRPCVIEQDIYATAYLLNLAFDLANEADREFRESGRQEGYKHEMTINRSYAIGALKDELIGLIASEDADERRRIMADLVEELQGELVAVREGRSFSRKGLEKRKGKGKGRRSRHNNSYKRAN